MDMGHFFFTQPNSTHRIVTQTQPTHPQPSKLKYRYLGLNPGMAQYLAAIYTGDKDIVHDNYSL